MGERKVLNKYFPPDFDPNKVPRRKFDPNKQIEVRMMLPFSMQCSTCGEFMYKGKKFNSRKEDVHGEDYHGVRKYRFYIKCATCSNEITFKTDPEKADYELETGGSRNYEVWKADADDKRTAEQQRESEDAGDAMKALENRTLDSRIEMEIMDALDEIKGLNRRHESVDTDALLAAARRRHAAAAAGGASAAAAGGGGLPAAEDEEELVRLAFAGRERTIRRLGDSDEEDAGAATGGSDTAAAAATFARGAKNGRMAVVPLGGGGSSGGSSGGGGSSSSLGPAAASSMALAGPVAAAAAAPAVAVQLKRRKRPAADAAVKPGSNGSGSNGVASRSDGQEKRPRQDAGAAAAPAASHAPDELAAPAKVAKPAKPTPPPPVLPQPSGGAETGPAAVAGGGGLAGLMGDYGSESD